MKNEAPFTYTLTEIQSYLPTGWGLDSKEPEGRWDVNKQLWRSTVIDTADLTWPLEIKAAEVGTLGRLEALRVAMDRVFRNRLGTPTRGLGLG